MELGKEGMDFLSRRVWTEDKEGVDSGQEGMILCQGGMELGKEGVK